MSGTAAVEKDDYTLFSTDPAVTCRLMSRKQRFFNMCGALISKAQLSPLTAAVLVFLSFAQVTAIVLESKFDYSNPLLKILRTLRLVTAVESVGSSLLYLVLLAIAVGGITANAVFIVIKYSCHSSPFLAYFSYTVPHFYWALLLPVTELLISAFQCDDAGVNQIVLSVSCKGTVHVILMSVAGTMLGLWTVVAGTFVIVEGYSSPHKQDPFGHYPWYFEVLYVGLRVLYCVNLRLTKTNYLLVPLLAVTLLYFPSLLWKTYPYYYQKVAFSFAMGVLCTLVAVIAVGVELCAELFSSTIDGLLGLACVGFVLVSLLLCFSIGRWYRVLMTTEPAEPLLIDAKIHVLRNVFLEGTRYISGQDTSLSMIKCGEDAAAEAESPKECKIIRRGKGRNTLSKGFQWGDKDRAEILLENKGRHISGATGYNVEVGRKRLVGLVAKYKLKDRNDLHFAIQMSAIYLHIVGSAHMAYAVLTEVEKNDPGVLVQFSIHLLKEEIFAAIEARKRKAGHKFGYSSFQKVIQFQSEFANLRRKMVENASVRMDFWSHIKVRPSLNRIQTVGFTIMQLNCETKKSWEILNKLNPLYIPALKLYKSYAKNVLGDKEEVAQLERRIQQAAMERSWRPLTLGDLFSENVAVIIMSGEDSKIVRASRSIGRILLYDPKELTGRNISVLMPPVIGRQHKSFISNFYGVNSGMATCGKQFPTFALNRQGYIVPVRVAVQQLFSFALGMMYVGAMQVDPQYKDDHYILTDTSGRICGITAKFCKKLRLSTTLIAERGLTLQNICIGFTERSLISLEDGITLKFVSTAEVFSEVSRHRNVRAASLLEKQQEPMLTVKCEVTTLKYSIGLTLKAFKIGKSVGENGEGKKHRAVIGMAVMQTVNTVLRALRKFKALAIRAAKNRAAGVPQTKRASLLKIAENTVQTPTKSSSGVLPTGSRVDEERFKETQEPLLSTTKEDLLTGSRGIGARAGKKSSKKFFPQLLQKVIEGQEKLSKFTTANATDTLANAYVNTRTIESKDKKTKSSSATAKIMKGISELRKRNSSGVTPVSVSYLKVATGLFIFLVIVLLSIRVGVSIWLNKLIVDFAPMMTANDNRLSALGKLVECTELLSLYYSFNSTGRIMIDDSARFSRYDYTYIMKDYDAGAKYTSYKQYLIKKTQWAIDSLKTEQTYIQGHMQQYSSALTDRVNQFDIEISYVMNGHSFSTTMSVERVVYTMISTGLDFIDEISDGTYNSSEYMARTIVTNILGVVVSGMRMTAAEIVDEAYSKITLHDDFSTVSFICLLALYAVYLVVFVPFLCLSNRDLVAMLMLFLDISRRDLADQHERALSFIKKVYHNERQMGREYGGDNEGPIDIMSFENNGLGINDKFLSEQQQLVDDDNNNNANGANKDGSATANHSMNESGTELESSTEKAHHKQQLPGKERKHNDKRHRSGRERPYAKYQSNTWKLLLLFCTFSGCMIGVYFVLDYFSKSSTRVASYKISELKYLSRAVYANGYVLPYLYNYIMTNKTGNCAVSTCDSYLESHFKSRMSELEQMIVYHKGNVSLLSNAYDTYFSDIFENNPCTSTTLGAVTNCSTFMGGIFTSGTHEATVRMIDMALSLFYDFKRSTGTLDDIQEFVNDQRLIDIEVLDLQFDVPAFTLMINYLKSSLQDDLRSGIVQIACLFSLFVAGFLAISLGWLVWIVKLMLRSIYGTKSLLCNMPDDMIARNEPLCKYLLNGSVAAADSQQAPEQ
ncbi:MAG: hypothetical protein P4M11_10755 [Candidatus Pacebacteria bacterium]|nr:hypothetical protein [Candidatus Paceibacterota bacterium]